LKCRGQTCGEAVYDLVSDRCILCSDVVPKTGEKPCMTLWPTIAFPVELL
jgi:hypothetical protein